MEKQIAIFAAGCFWGVESKLRSLPGVSDAVAGYTGGMVENPTYHMVCTNTTGHAEAVQVKFDPELISYQSLVEAFFNIHNPTTLNRQGLDVGSQYRSAIFYHDEEQRQTAQSVKKAFDSSGKFRDPIVTEILPAEEFYKAEDYHQRYYEKQGFTRS